MKVEAGEKAFEKVVVTLETKEEFEGLFHSMNVASSVPLDDYLRRRESICTEEIKRLTVDLFTELNEINRDRKYNL